MDYSNPSGDREPSWSTEATNRITFNPNFDEFGDDTHWVIQILSILDDSSQHMTPLSTISTNNMFVPKILLIMKNSGFIWLGQC